MNPVVSHAVRRAISQQLQAWSRQQAVTLPSVRSNAANRWICADCRSSNERARVLSPTTRNDKISPKRWLSTSPVWREETRTSQSTPKDTAPSASTDATLPSTTDSRRSALTKRLTHLTDNILTRASIAGQHINEYTGTDYTAITTIRTQIAAQEELVRTHHAAVSDARTTHASAFTQQAGAQKEIVGLLERKSNWTPADLDRYMALVRSEHVNEQAVQTAKEGLAVAERELEDSRALLERLERKQYHEEQIWSDTIRRNSTWVTFGLMGVNILLLLANIAVFEPWRRRRIVREVEKVVTEQAAVGKQEVAVEDSQRVNVPVKVPDGATVKMDIMIDGLPEGVVGRVVSAEQISPLEWVVQAELDPPYSTTPNEPPAEASEVPPPSSPTPGAAAKSPNTWNGTWESYVESFQDLFSERLVQLKKVDVTTTALQGAATGVAAMGLLFVVFRPR